jgi:hypothetical protein
MSWSSLAEAPPPSADHPSSRHQSVAPLPSPSDARKASPREGSVSRQQRLGLADQGQERRLERIIGLMLVPQNRPADAEHERPVSLDQGGERQLHRLTATDGEPLHQLAAG